MNDIVSIIYIMIMSFMSVLYYFMQNWSSDRIFYGILIPYEYRSKEKIKNAENTYKKSIIISGVFFIILQIVISVVFRDTPYKDSTLIVYTVPFIANLIVDFIIYYKTHLKIKFIKDKYINDISSILKTEMVQIQDIDFLSEKNKILRKYKWIYSIPTLIVVVIAVYSSFRYDPSSGAIPVHFGLDGIPDRFTDNTVVNYFSNIIMAIVLSIIIPVSSLYSIKSRVNIDFNNLEEDKKTALFCIEGFAFSMFITCIGVSGISCIMILSSISADYMNSFIMTIFVLLIFVSIIPMIYFTSKLKHGFNNCYSPDNEDKYWLIGSIYNNPNDPSLFVQKRFGLGWTVNIGNLKGKLVIAAVVLFILFTLIYSFIII